MTPLALFARLAIFAALVLVSVGVSPAHAVIIDFGDGGGNLDPPPGFPYWRNVEQRVGGTSVIYLGDGWVLTARHVGAGLVLFGDDRYAPDPDTVTYFGDPNRPADLMLFRLATKRPWPDLPMLLISKQRPTPGQSVMLVGSGRNRGGRIHTRAPSGVPLVGWTWGANANKRWGTNRVIGGIESVDHEHTSTRAFTTRFDSLYGGGATEFEAQAADGDSGGAVFARRDRDAPTSEWELAGVIFTVSHPLGGPTDTALYGDLTHAVDLTAYRAEIVARVRPACFDEIDNDGDGLVDHPDDPDCAARSDASEGPSLAPNTPMARPVGAWIAAVGLVIALVVAAVVLARITRASRRPR